MNGALSPPTRLLARFVPLPQYLLKCPVQSRRLHLYYAVTTKVSHHTNHRIRAYDEFHEKYVVPGLLPAFGDFSNSHELQLNPKRVSSLSLVNKSSVDAASAENTQSPKEPGALATVTLDKVFCKITPGRALLPARDLPKFRESHRPLNGPFRYNLVTLRPAQKVDLSLKRNRVKRGAKEHHFLASTPAAHIAHRLGKCYTHLEQSIPVEMHIHSDDSMGYPLLWMLQNCIHLRPEVILQAMPKDTKITVPPLTNGEEVCWIMERGKRAKDKSKDISEQKELSLVGEEQMKIKLAMKGSESQSPLPKKKWRRSWFPPRT